MKRNFKKVRARLPSFILAGFLCLMAVMAILFLKSIGQILEENTRVNLLETARQSAGGLREKLQSDLMLMQSISAAISQHDIRTQDPGVLSLLESQKADNEFATLGIILTDGTGYKSSGEPMDAHYVPLVHDAEKNQVSISDVKTLSSGERGIIYQTPVMSPTGHQAGVLFATRTIEKLEDFLTARVFNGQCYALVLHRDGRVLFYSDNYPDERNYDNYFSYIDRVHRNLYMNDNLREDIKAGTSGILRFDHRFAEDRYMSYCPIEGIDDWYVLTVVPVSVASLQVQRVLTLTAVACIILIGGIGCLTGYLLYTRARNKRQLEHLAYIDPVTGLFNGNRFKKDALELMRRRDAKNLALVSFDVENFKLVNDLFGYECGDKVLRLIAESLRGTFEEDGIYAHQSGDKFLIMLRCDDADKLEKRLYGFFERICRLCPAGGTQTNFELTFACGVFLLPPEYGKLSVDALIDRATIARKSVKRGHKHAVAFYDDVLFNQIVEEKTIENDMKRALENEEFVLYLQPQYNSVMGYIISAEALVRWQHPKKGLLQPGAFVPIFERNGFITQMDLYIFERVCRLLRSWIDKGIPPLPISFNMSRLHLHNPAFPETLKKIRDQYGLPGNLLVVELTESAFFDGKGQLLATMSQLKRDGFFISIDDFGTGYSSLNLLKDMPADEVKLDREFFESSAENERGRTIISSIVGMAQRLNMSIVAEGVETVEQVNLLRLLGCNIIQGFYFARPMPMEDFERRYVKQLREADSKERNDIVVS